MHDVDEIAPCFHHSVDIFVRAGRLIDQIAVYSLLSKEHVNTELARDAHVHDPVAIDVSDADLATYANFRG